MERRHRQAATRSLLAAIAAAAYAGSAGALTIPVEGFDTDGAGTRYAVAFGGGSGDDFWGLQSIGNSFGFTGQQGADFFGGRDLDGTFGGGGPGVTRSVSLPLGAPLGVSGPSDAFLSILLAAPNAGDWDAGQDFLRIFAIDDDTTGETLLDEFLPVGGNLQSAVYGTELTSAFQDFTWMIPPAIANLTIRIDAYSTGDLEYLGFDDVRLVIAPEPSTALLLGLSLWAVALRGHSFSRSARNFTFARRPWNSRTGRSSRGSSGTR